MNHLLSLASIFVLVVVSSACGDSETPSDLCPSGIFDSAGACVSVTCSTGTVLVDGGCVPDESVCGPDTTWVDGQCLPDGTTIPIECSEGTSLTEDGLRCVPDVVCGPGTVPVEGECLSDDEIVVIDADADESEEENDPAFGGTPQAIELKGVGNSYLLKGQIAAPEDKNASGRLDQDIDVYQFSGENAGYVRVRVLPLGQGSFGFEVSGPQGYYRQGPRHLAAPGRTLLLPADGDYQIRVQPQATLFQMDAGPVGGDDYGYLLILENVGSLDPEEGSVLNVNSIESFVGNFSEPEKNLIKLQFPAQTYARLTLESVGSSVQPALLLLDDTGRVLEQLPTGRTSFLINGAVANSRWVYLDAVTSSGLNDRVEIRGDSLETIRFLSELKGGETVSRSQSDSVQPNQQRYFAIDVNLETPQGMATPQGLVIDFRLAKPAFVPSLLRAFSPNGALLSENEGNSVLFYASESGTYLVEFGNQDEVNSLPFADVFVRSHVPVDLGTLDTTNNTSRMAPYTVAANSMTYFTFRTTEAATLNVTPTGVSLPSSMTLYGDDMVARVATQSPDLAVQRHVVASSARRVGMLNNIGFGTLSGQISVSASAAPMSVGTPNLTLSTAAPLTQGDSRLAQVNSQGQNYYLINVGQPQSIEFRVDTEGFHNLLLELLDKDGIPIERGRSTSTGYSVGAVLQANESYYLKLSNTDTKSSVYALFADVRSITATLESEPNQQASEATTVPWVGASSTLNMAGTLTGFGDQDWFEFNLPQSSWVTTEFLSINGFTPTHNGMRVTFYDANGTTELPFEGSVLLPAGKSYARVNSPNLFLSGNSYHLRVTGSQFQPLGILANGDTIDREGVFTASKLREGFSFTLSSALPAGQAVVAWSNATITVFDEDGDPVHVSTNSNQVFGSDRDPSFFGQGLAAGTYFVTIESDIAESWVLFVGRMTRVNESEMPGANTNDTYATAESLGTLAAGTPIYRVGSVGFSDPVDYFTFTVPPSAQMTRRVVIQQFQLGEAVADLDLALHDSDDIPLDNVQFTPQVIDMNLEPGTYAVLSDFFDDVGSFSRDYMLRIRMF